MPLSRRVRTLLVVAGLVTAGGVVSVALRPPSARQRFFELRPELQRARLAADSCRQALDAERNAFRALITRTDAVKSRIGELEALDRRGVPADSYVIYLAAVDSFNASVPEWEAAADSFRAHRVACEAVVRAHNSLADSARALAEEAQLLEAMDSAGSD
jgi:hypothetical protein